MKSLLLLFSMLSAGILQAQSSNKPADITFTTYNVSMEAENYVPRGTKGNSEKVLVKELSTGTNTQIKNIASIIQTVRPDVILLNEFDYVQNPDEGVKAFIKNYLNKDQNGAKAIDYPYYYYATVNTGQPSPFDLDNNGKKEQFGSDAWGFGMYPGQYGMVLLSKYPIDTKNIRTFQHFKWKDMPDHQRTMKADGSDWYAPEAWAQFPLSSKSHWDVPLKVGKKTIHALVSHPTPPTFDGAEDRNGKRNFDEIRFWKDYITEGANAYIYDDKQSRGGLKSGSSFVIMGDQNASPDEGNAINGGIRALIEHPLIIGNPQPESKGGAQHSPDNKFAKSHTAFWRMRADYVLPSRRGLKIKDSGVFWPAKGEPMWELVEKRESSSDHRLVWVRMEVL
ncbi:endonuclease/exonuclease/phosphatase family protein [Dyadobacter luteus]|uniref:Endonuclease/exonuclease/phosphatase family protein n=1 Tax=Dyadobacter luteus TaxID=2259619 RepID=A0A3D8Y233_9BACT|nr:endonuclease/exonuclease/phosphatase family protein [Dyadobacter luteus]REA54975.1 endonuclease/exonuclease/phosphatase family protein [Dyadobacter luteus]